MDGSICTGSGICRWYFVGGISLVLGAIVMLLWNALIPELLSGPMLTYWQAVGLYFLTHLLFVSGTGTGKKD